MAALVLEFKAMIKQYITPFTLTQRQKQLLMKVILMMYLNQLILQFYQTHKDLSEWLKPCVEFNTQKG